MDDHPPVRPDTLAQLAREDLDPLSVEELDARIVALEVEIARTRSRRSAPPIIDRAPTRCFASERGVEPVGLRHGS